MASKRRVKRKLKKRQCGEKVAYRDKDAVLSFLSYLKREGLDVEPVNVYHCEFCGWWHYGRSGRLG